MKILVTSALPYANGDIHLGHLAGAYLPADIYVRYQRLKGRDVIHICGTDEHGVTITVLAEKKKKTPQEIVDLYHESIKKSFFDFGISFDNFSRTTLPLHYRLAQDFFLQIYKKGYIYEKLTAWEYLTFIAGLYHMDEDTFTRNAMEYLNIFGLSEWKDELISNFSMGMKQRLLLSSAFMRNPKVIILDEPHNGLDPKGVRLLKDVLYKLRNEETTIVLSTHIIAIAEQICDRIAIINKGSVVAEGTNEDLKYYARSTDKTLEDIFLRLTSDYETPGVKA